MNLFEITEQLKAHLEAPDRELVVTESRAIEAAARFLQSVQTLTECAKSEAKRGNGDFTESDKIIREIFQAIEKVEMAFGRKPMYPGSNSDKH